MAKITVGAGRARTGAAGFGAKARRRACRARAATRSVPAALLRKRAKACAAYFSSAEALERGGGGGEGEASRSGTRTESAKRRWETTAAPVRPAHDAPPDRDQDVLPGLLDVPHALAWRGDWDRQEGEGCKPPSVQHRLTHDPPAAACLLRAPPHLRKLLVALAPSWLLAPKSAVDAAPSVDAVEGAASGLLRFSGGASERGNAGRGGRTL